MLPPQPRTASSRVFQKFRHGNYRLVGAQLDGVEFSRPKNPPKSFCALACPRKPARFRASPVLTSPIFARLSFFEHPTPSAALEFHRGSFTCTATIILPAILLPHRMVNEA